MKEYPINKINAREAAYQALLLSQRQEQFIDDSLDLWNQQQSPSRLDFNLAKEIACGACRRALTLDYYAAALAGKKISMKRKERLLLHIALYQHFFMDRIPLYALVDETVRIAKKYCHATFAKFANALLRKLETAQIPLPTGESVESLSIQHSYPAYYVEKLIEDYGLKHTIEILKAGNLPGKTMARVRSPQTELPIGSKPISCPEINMIAIESTECLQTIAKSPNYYIQNITPALLIHHLASQIPPPKQILDLCASPGGKIIAIHDKFPQAMLFGNDLSEEKLTKLKENLSKYGIKADLKCGLGENYPREMKFDLVILDVPCSNTGVLNKRPEARWRLTHESMEGMKKTQLRLLEHALTLLKPQGELWYMTCSILRSENEQLVDEFSMKHSLKIRTKYNYLPSENGCDGGFGCALSQH